MKIGTHENNGIYSCLKTLTIPFTYFWQDYVQAEDLYQISAWRLYKKTL